MRLTLRRKQPVPWNHKRVRNYERERAMQAFRGLLLFLFVGLSLGLVIAGSQGRLWIPESLWDFVTVWVDGQ